MAIAAMFPPDHNSDQLRLQRAMLFQFSECALKADDLDDVLDAAPELIAEATEGDFVQLLELLPGGRGMLLRSAAGLTPEAIENREVEDDEGSPIRHALLTSVPVISGDTAGNGQFGVPERLRQFGVHSVVDVVIKGRSKPWGILEVSSCEDRQFDQDDLTFLQSTADFLSAAVERFAEADRQVPYPLYAEPPQPEALDDSYLQPLIRELPELEEDAAIGFVSTPTGSSPTGPLRRIASSGVASHDHVRLPPARRPIGVALFGLLLAGSIATIWWTSRPSPVAKAEVSLAIGSTKQDAPVMRAASPPEPPQPVAMLSPAPPRPKPKPTRMVTTAAPHPTGSKAAIRALQSDLALLGYDVGPIDGVLGPLTRKSLAAWRARHGRGPAGPLSDADRRLIHSEAVRSVPARFR